MRSVTTQLHEFDERTAKVGRVDEGDSCPAAADARLRVDEPGTLRLEMGQSSVDVDDCVGDMMETFTMLGQEFAHRGFFSQRLKQLNEGATHRNHRLLDALAHHLLAVKGLYAIAVAISVNGRVEVGDGNGDVVQVEQLHGATGYSESPAGTIG